MSTMIHYFCYLLVTLSCVWLMTIVPVPVHALVVRGTQMTHMRATFGNDAHLLPLRQ
jgi:hypothetical protein